MSRLVPFHYARPALRKKLHIDCPGANLRQFIRSNSSQPPNSSAPPSSSEPANTGDSSKKLSHSERGSTRKSRTLDLSGYSKTVKSSSSERSGSSKSPSPFGPFNTVHPRDSHQRTTVKLSDIVAEEKAKAAGNSNETSAFKFPDLMQPDPLYDSAISGVFYGQRSGKHSKITIRNEPPLFRDQVEEGVDDTKAFEKMDELDFAPISRKAMLPYHVYPLVSRYVTQQTGKGKIRRFYRLVVIGDGKGLVGVGEGKHAEPAVARRKAMVDALRNVDFVERFEQRTIWTDMETKFGATKILMRPRPVGFGLACNPNVHQVLKAAGIKDVSAKVWGSRNPINVIKATCRMIQSGNAPLSMGDGLGGKGKKMEAGSGMRGRETFERERGRKIVDGRTW